MVNHESWKSIYFVGQKVKGEGQVAERNSAVTGLGHDTLVSAGFF